MSTVTCINLLLLPVNRWFVDRQVEDRKRLSRKRVIHQILKGGRSNNHSVISDCIRKTLLSSSKDNTKSFNSTLLWVPQPTRIRYGQSIVDVHPV